MSQFEKLMTFMSVKRSRWETERYWNALWMHELEDLKREAQEVLEDPELASMELPGLEGGAKEVVDTVIETVDQILPIRRALANPSRGNYQGETPTRSIRSVEALLLLGAALVAADQSRQKLKRWKFF